MGENQPSIRIVLTANGVEVVQFVGEGWDQEAETMKIYNQIKPLIQQMDRILKGHTAGSDVVQ